MIEGGWEFVSAAYAVAIGAIGVMTAIVVVRLNAWARRARELDKNK